MLALAWLYCFVVVDNEGITIYFLHTIIPRLSNSVQPMSILHDIKMKKNAPCFQIRAGGSDTGFVTEKPRRATGVEPVIPGVQILTTR